MNALGVDCYTVWLQDTLIYRFIDKKIQDVKMTVALFIDHISLHCTPFKTSVCSAVVKQLAAGLELTFRHLQVNSKSL